MDLNDILKAIVPLAFLAIWALTALFNREGTTLPARGPAQPNPFGPRPGIPPRAAAAAERPPTLRWGQQPGAPPRPGGDDDIVIIDSTRNIRTITPRPVRRVRPKPAPPAPTKPAPIVSTRIGMGNVAQNVNQQIVTPLTGDSVASTVGRSVAGKETRALDMEMTAVSAAALSRSLADPKRLREAILLQEILQPPLALRGRARRG